MVGKIKENKLTLAVIAVCILLFSVCALWARPVQEDSQEAAEYAEYENGVVIAMLSDSTVQDETSDGGYRGEQMMTVRVTTGRYKGKELLTYNFVGPLYGVPVHEGDKVTLTISTYADGSLRSTVYEYNHVPGLLLLTGLFILASVVIGGKNGAKSVISLAFIFLNVFLVLLPALMKGAPTIPTTFFVCLLVAAFSFAINSGVGKKSVCAFLGTASGVALALAFAAFAQYILRINGLRMDDVEALLQLRQTGTNIGLKGLLSASVIISSLGAVMDVAMGLASSISEVHDADHELGFVQLFKSGTNIGRDMVGTMTSTLIMAFVGSSFVLILYLYSMNLGKYQLLSSSYMSIEVISSLASSIGVILSIPITNFITARAYGSRKA